MAVLSPILEVHTRNGFPAKTTWENVVAPVRPFLADVSERLAGQADAFEPEIAEYARYALANQGKQLRPTLVALAGGTIGPAGDELVKIAVVIEMIHLATLVHDDIMDAATMRRSQPTLSARWGNQVSVLLGDCLFAHALKLASDFSTTDISRAIARSTGTVCTGEILQTHRRRRWTLGRAEYFKVLEMKTAELFGLACELGAKLAGGTVAEQEALRRHGLALGTAYQVYDDCLDLYGSEETAGKSLGTDLATGKVTLPLLVFFERAGASERQEVLSWLDQWDPERFGDVRERLERHGALAESAAAIDSLLADARAALVGIPPGPATRSLNGLADFLSEQTAALGG